MAVKELKIPMLSVSKATEPTMEREEVFLSGGNKYKHEGFEIDVPNGKYYKIIVKAIVHELTEEEYGKAMETEESWEISN